MLAAWRSPSGPEGRQGEANGSQSGPEGRQEEAKGGKGEANRTLGRLPWELLGASLVREDFEGTTSNLAEAFYEKLSDRAQNSNASIICFEKT